LVTKKQVHKSFRRAVFERDNYWCKLCEWHDPYADIYELNKEIELVESNLDLFIKNSITLCRDCTVQVNADGYDIDILYKKIS